MCDNRSIQPALGTFEPEPDPHRTHLRIPAGQPDPHRTHPRIPAGQPDPPRPIPDHGEVTPPRPGAVTAAVVMTYLGTAVLALPGVVLLIGSTNAYFAQGVAEDLGVAGMRAAGVAAVGLILLVISTFVAIVAAAAHRGRNGGRITLCIIGCIWTLLGLIDIAGGATQEIFGVVWIATGVALLLTPGANRWYRNSLTRPR